MPGLYVRLKMDELEALRREAGRDRRMAQDEAAILITEALRARRSAEDLEDLEPAETVLRAS